MSKPAETRCTCGRAPAGQEATPLGCCHDCGRTVCCWCGCTDGRVCLCDACAQVRLERQGPRGEETA